MYLGFNLAFYSCSSFANYIYINMFYIRSLVRFMLSWMLNNLTSFPLKCCVLLFKVFLCCQAKYLIARILKLFTHRHKNVAQITIYFTFSFFQFSLTFSLTTSNRMTNAIAIVIKFKKPFIFNFHKSKPILSIKMVFIYTSRVENLKCTPLVVLHSSATAYGSIFR